MSEPLAAIERTRNMAAGIVTDCVKNIVGKSEAEVRDEILAAMKAAPQMYERGWYDPPPSGVSVLFGRDGYERLQYDSLRHSQYFPRDDVRFDTETVAQLYLSPVDRATGLFGDFDCSIYSGSNENVRSHIRTVRDIIISLAEHARIGMSFRELYEAGQELFSRHDKMIGWMTTVHDPMQINLGHTMPGSYEGSYAPKSLEEIVPVIGEGRVYINAHEEFVIPRTCALTIEARLTDLSRTLPNVIFHVIVTFSEGEKKILANFDEVFSAAGMDYML